MVAAELITSEGHIDHSLVFSRPAFPITFPITTAGTVDIFPTTSSVTGLIGIPSFDTSGTGAGIMQPYQYGILSNLIGSPINQQILSDLHSTIVGHYDSTGGIGTINITATGSNVTVSVLGDNVRGNFVYWPVVENNIKNMVKNKIKQNTIVRVLDRTVIFDRKVSIQEQKARYTLRDMLTEQEWRKYVTNGFIMVKGSANYWYQIIANSGVNVYKDGKKLHYICIHTDQSCPPTDHVINMKLLIEMDEMSLWHNGNIREASMSNRLSHFAVSPKKTESILETYQRLKSATPLPNNFLSLAGTITDTTIGGSVYAMAC